MGLYNAYLALSGAIDADISRDERMSHRTSYRIGGPAAMLAQVHTISALTRTIDVLTAQGVDWVVVGKGSNLLVADEGFDGCVIVLGRDFSHVEASREGATVCAGAAVPLSKVVTTAAKACLTGLEFACGIPGTLGGAISMDAGTRREWIGQRVESLVVYRPGTGLMRRMGSEVEWGYRWCSLGPSDIVLETTLALAPGEREKIDELMEARFSQRRSTQPMGKPSCGSVFRNPVGPKGAARLVEDCGLKGYAHGGAQVSTTHANFIVNNGNATAADVLAVMRTMHDRVREATGVDLQPEVKFLGRTS